MWLLARLRSLLALGWRHQFLATWASPQGNSQHDSYQRERKRKHSPLYPDLGSDIPSLLSYSISLKRVTRSNSHERGYTKGVTTSSGDHRVVLEAAYYIYQSYLRPNPSLIPFCINYTERCIISLHISIFLLMGTLWP